MGSLRAEGAAATSASHFVEALRFLHAIAGLRHMPLERVLSSRVLGVARDTYLDKRPLEQKPQLTVDMVEKLEKFCLNSNDRDSCISGQHLLCIHAAARWADGQRIVKVDIQTADDEVLVIADGLGSKTAVTKEAKTRFLPYVCIGSGLYHPWATRWMEAREAEGLTFENFSLPAWSDRTGSWAQVAMSSGQASDFLRDYLIAMGVPQEEALKRSSHSLKATLTTWAARSTQVPFNSTEQRLLGHHVKPKDKSPLTYSRQAFTTLYGKVLQLFRSIRDLSYDPDLSEVDRVLAIADASAQPPSPRRLAPQQVEPDEELGDSSESSASGSEEIGPALEGNRDPKGRVPFAEPVDWDAIWVHKVSGITHCLKEGSEARSFFCGRFKSDRYIKFLEAGPAAEDPDFCLQCCKARDG